MSAVMNTIGVAFAYAVLALFAQNAIFTRGLGVSCLIQLVGDERTSSWWFALLLCVCLLYTSNAQTAFEDVTLTEADAEAADTWQDDGLQVDYVLRNGQVDCVLRRLIEADGKLWQLQMTACLLYTSRCV